MANISYFDVNLVIEKYFPINAKDDLSEIESKIEYDFDEDYYDEDEFNAGEKQDEFNHKALSALIKKYYNVSLMEKLNLDEDIAEDEVFFYIADDMLYERFENTKEVQEAINSFIRETKEDEYSFM